MAFSNRENFLLKSTIHYLGVVSLSPIFIVFILLFSIPANPESRILITEVLKDPVGLETECPGGKSHEFIEFINLGYDTFSIDSLFLSDGVEVDSAIPWASPLSWHQNCCFGRRVVLPGQCALILDKDYVESPSTHYFVIADSSVILTVDASSLAAGLTTTKGLILYKGTRKAIREPVAVFLDSGYNAALGERLYQTQPATIAEGFSYIPANIILGYPKYIASPETLSLGAYEFMQNSWVCEYKLDNTVLSGGIVIKPSASTQYYPAGAGRRDNTGVLSPTIVCSLAVLMAGIEKPQNASWVITKRGSNIPVASGILPAQSYPVRFCVNLPKDSVAYGFTIEENGKKAEIIIDISGIWLPGSHIKINEIFPRAAATIPEWIELVNVSSMPINLKNWRYGTPEGFDNIITTSDIFIEPGNFIVLCKSSSEFAKVYPVAIKYIQPATWQSLDNYRDTLCLFNSIAQPACEKVYYDYNWFDSWNDQSVERISLVKNGIDKTAWVLAEKPSPGQPNPGVIWHSATKPDMHIGPVPFSPNSDGIDDSLCIRITLPASQRASIAIYGFNGQKLYDMPEPVGNISMWNGRAFDGRHAPAGPFFVVATIKNGSSETQIRKKGILWR